MLSDNLLKKYALKAGQRIRLVDAPQDLSRALAELVGPEIALMEAPIKGVFDQFFWWPADLQGLADRLSSMAHSIRPDGAIWLLMPKKKFARERGIDFSWEQMQSKALETDLVDNKIASFSETDYGTRFVIRREHRHRYSGAGEV